CELPKRADHPRFGRLRLLFASDAEIEPRIEIGMVVRKLFLHADQVAVRPPERRADGQMAAKGAGTRKQGVERKRRPEGASGKRAVACIDWKIGGQPRLQFVDDEVEETVAAAGLHIVLETEGRRRGSHARFPF